MSKEGGWRPNSGESTARVGIDFSAPHKARRTMPKSSSALLCRQMRSRTRWHRGRVDGQGVWTRRSNRAWSYRPGIAIRLASGNRCSPAASWRFIEISRIALRHPPAIGVALVDRGPLYRLLRISPHNGSDDQMAFAPPIPAKRGFARASGEGWLTTGFAPDPLTKRAVELNQSLLPLGTVGSGRL